MIRLLLAPLLAAPLVAQTQVSAPRLDGRSTPLMVYRAEGSSGCAPLAVISHGAGGSERGYRYLAREMSHNGFTTVVMGHRESGLSALGKDIRENGIRPGVRELVVDPPSRSLTPAGCNRGAPMGGPVVQGAVPRAAGSLDGRHYRDARGGSQE